MSVANASPSLDKGCKYPTHPADLVTEHGELLGNLKTHFPDAEITGPGTYVRLCHRKWSGEFRMQCVTEVLNRKPPPLQSGARVTTALSQRGKRAIADSCAYVGVKRGGYTTHLTLTLAPDARARIEDHYPEGPFCNVRWKSNGKPDHERNITYVGAPGIERLEGTSIQKEVSRFFDAAGKMHARGWISPYRVGRKLKGSDGAEYIPISWGSFKNQVDPIAKHLDIGPGMERPFDYLWVAENPIGENGKRNPHIHVLLRWKVPKKYFYPWARRLERLWGQGFAHLQLLKNPKSAAVYLAKAAGYLTKSANGSEQGPIRGNRFGMAKCARAPAWQQLSSLEWGCLGERINEARQLLESQQAPLLAQRSKALMCLKELPKGAKDERKRAEDSLKAANRKLRASPIVFGRYQVIAKGADALDKFMLWAERRGWRQAKRPQHLWSYQWMQLVRNVRPYRHLISARCRPIPSMILKEVEPRYS